MCQYVFYSRVLRRWYTLFSHSHTEWMPKKLLFSAATQLDAMRIMHSRVLVSIKSHK